MGLEVRDGFLWKKKSDSDEWVKVGDLGKPGFKVTIDNNLAFDGEFHSVGRSIRYEQDGQVIKEEFIPNKQEDKVEEENNKDADM